MVRLGKPRDEGDEVSLSEWLPARSADEPRIPDIYSRAWAERGSVDVLLALARTALRLDEPDELASISSIAEAEVASEYLDLDDLDDTDDGEPDDDDDDVEVSETTRAVLNRYRGAFMRRLNELVGFVKTVDDQDLADLAFQTTLVQHERLMLDVAIDKEIVLLIEPFVLMRQKLDLLEANLEEGRRRPVVHGDRAVPPRRMHPIRERVHETGTGKAGESCIRHGRRIIDTALPSNPVDGLFGMGLEDAAGWIEEYVARTDWPAVAEHAGEYLDQVELFLRPFPVWLERRDSRIRTKRREEEDPRRGMCWAMEPSQPCRTMTRSACWCTTMAAPAVSPLMSLS